MDGGDHWKEYEISDHHFKPAPIGGLGQGYQGDIIDLTSTDSKIWPVWMDNSSGIYQIWTAPIDFSSLNGVDDPGMQSGFNGLSRNFPNPFNTETTISYRITSPGFVSLKVFDTFGILLAELVKENQPPGYYEVKFNPDIWILPKPASGVFFYRLTLNERSEAGKMVYFK
jgi:hypothetical protein